MDRTDRINTGRFNCYLAIFLPRPVQKLIRSCRIEFFSLELLCPVTLRLSRSDSCYIIKNDQYGSQTKNGGAE